jgi:GDP-L-fucose synthase
MKKTNFYSGKRVLVTGASGLTGSHVVQALLDQGAMVRAVQHTTHLPVQDFTWIPPNLEGFHGGLCNIESCQDAVKDIEIVFHCAAVTSGAYDIVNNPAKHITPNLIMCSRILECSALAGVQRFVFMSSSTVYPDGTRAMKEEEAWTGDVHPSYEAVGWMKRYVEKMCEFYNNRTKMKVCIVRPANIYGPRDKFDLAAAHVVPALIHKIVRGDNPLEVWGTGDEFRELIYVKDIVRGLLLAAERYCYGKPINIGSSCCFSIKTITEAILALCNKQNVVVKFNSSKPVTIPIRRLDSSLAEAVLDFKCKWTLAQGLAATIKWFQSNGVLEHGSQ